MLAHRGVVTHQAVADDYGHAKLGELVRAQAYVEVRDPTQPGPEWVRLKPKPAR